jgi:hypothetical protein
MTFSFFETYLAWQVIYVHDHNPEGVCHSTVQNVDCNIWDHALVAIYTTLLQEFHSIYSNHMPHTFSFLYITLPHFFIFSGDELVFSSAY